MPHGTQFILPYCLENCTFWPEYLKLQISLKISQYEPHFFKQQRFSERLPKCKAICFQSRAHRVFGSQPYMMSDLYKSKQSVANGGSYCASSPKYSSNISQNQLFSASFQKISRAKQQSGSDQVMVSGSYHFQLNECLLQQNYTNAFQ